MVKPISSTQRSGTARHPRGGVAALSSSTKVYTFNPVTSTALRNGATVSILEAAVSGQQVAADVVESTIPGITASVRAATAPGAASGVASAAQGSGN